MDQEGMLNAWLVRKSGPLAGARRMIRGDVTRVGRGPDNDVVIDEMTTISAHHFEIRKESGSYKIQDLNSTNGTFVNGERIGEAILKPSSSIQLGSAGPEFAFVLDDGLPVDLNQTIDGSARQALEPTAVPIGRPHEELLSDAVARARDARRTGIGDQTIRIMREMLVAAMRRTHRRFKVVILMLVAALLASMTFGLWKIELLKKEKRTIDAEIANLEARLQQSALSEQTDQLADRLDQYEDQARTLQASLLYRFQLPQPVDPVERSIRTLMAEFGAETYSVPPEFLEQVKRFIEHYQGPDRPHIISALGRSRHDVATMRRILQEAHLPPDLAYMVVVESAVSTSQKSSAGAAGMWQFTAPTARAFGLTVNRDLDERLDVRKSTVAACKVLRELILDFGAGSSVMLALAAYNSGSTKVKQGIRKVVDPIKQRNFWYLYRVRALPAETREYVPKVIAAMIIARDPRQFGFA
jgi:pSer/pThr/pTyr-binding forkhead associated (FHA) protein/soluble lytic murein transglycosylase-like protein